MPGASVFVDTNVFLYSRQINADAKSLRAAEWLLRLAETQAGHTNLQVLNELANALFRKRPDMNEEEVFSAVDELRSFGETVLNWKIVVKARDLRRRYHYSWWDCLLLASALELGCSHFLSEDLQDGQVIESLTIIDPFAHSPQEILISR